jgi:protein TonB
MQAQITNREAGTKKVSTAYENDRSRMYFALTLLLVALIVLVVKDRDFWFGDADAQVADQTTPEWVPNHVAPAATAPVAQSTPARKQIATAKVSAKPAAAEEPTVAIKRTAVPPLEIEVVGGDSRNTFHLSSSSANVVLPSDSGYEAAAEAPAERVQMAVAKVPAGPQTSETYPLLGRQMKVQGSVLLQALIGADGIIRDLRVLRGPAILASAAREAARRWQFKPYLQNGKAVETQANITVNFTIKVLNNNARDQMDSVVALSRGGE